MFTISDYEKLVQFVRGYFNRPTENIPLHEPKFTGNERKYVVEAIDSTFVSSVGNFVNEFESMMCKFTGAKYAVATVNGTAALHLSLLVSGVNRGDLVIAQPLSFIATCNAISYTGAIPIFVDIDRDTLGLSPEKLDHLLSEQCSMVGNKCIHKATGRHISACIPMHTFGHPTKIDEIAALCNKHNIALIEDAAESIGSYYMGRHTGTFGLMGIFSFNGNKTITCGGGGMIVTNNSSLATRAKHLSTQAKLQHPWEFVHDEVGYNYRLPNLNAAMACAQMEALDQLLESKRELALGYLRICQEIGMKFVVEPENSMSNYWLNAVLLNGSKERDELLEYSNKRGIMTRPVWRLMSELEMFKSAPSADLTIAKEVSSKLVNLPSSPK